MGFLQHLANYYDLKAYERRLNGDLNRMRSELKYCQDLLVDEATNADITPSRQGEINAYVAHIKEEREFQEMMRTFRMDTP
jgi:hypothetical protein